AAPLPVDPAPKGRIARKRPARKASPETVVDLLDWNIDENVEESSFPDESAMLAMSPPRDLAILEMDTAQHIEKAQLLLRAFRNAAAGGRSKAYDVEYEREKSRELVYRNIVLRRDAQAQNNYPVEEALASLEPLLLDIANLPASPSRDEMRSIVERMEKMEILATLQVHSGPVAVQGR
ncbi:MAG TPA: hypothetical protein VNO14_02985, partial [Blastocatellia bacterium]|nr:hypothetical protein [Blastocatellia bacterium]